MKKIILAAVAAGTLSAGPALANGDWTGFYAGIQAGNLDVDTNIGASGDDTSYGVHAGYRWDFGQWVAGGEFEYDSTDVTLGAGAATVDEVMRLKGTIGFDIGRTLIYAAAGWAEVDTSLGSDDGAFVGLGLAYQVTPNTVLGLEVLEHDFNNINGSAVDADATSVSVRASFRF
ncbi:outer membrane beta-barrel protein [Aestuariivita sp.]|jgi:opacity protein-like surface antigen|uniref:outer membrane beta-barrel protein n=1 Tax=Aestuariivita sp. TaxID=1872407 RepID=UPI0021726CAA|nr:outer membrane beta-barrel protein [Aestuariivita sp.]MCE8009301.1 porin family protein [Aestuariivita sp.]|eukprot:TRINITY_DN8336_c3_g1_i1.p2 TRINITY_DN8336_c3_g1~~TRINITY_DN8336_c3_g1_i1.p2  ORF type:complete len:174 (-),score=9.41 TRINITY_DN8336_c3_g1_i1:117-638(-)